MCIDPLKKSRNDPKHYWGRGRRPGSSRRHRILEGLSSLLRDSGTQFSYTRLVFTNIYQGWVKLTFLGQLSQQRSIENQVTQLTVSFFVNTFISRTDRRSLKQGFFELILQTSWGRMMFRHSEIDIVIETTGGERKDRIYSLTVGQAQSKEQRCWGWRWIQTAGDPIWLLFKDNCRQMCF